MLGLTCNIWSRRSQIYFLLELEGLDIRRKGILKCKSYIDSCRPFDLPSNNHGNPIKTLHKGNSPCFPTVIRLVRYKQLNTEPCYLFITKRKKKKLTPRLIFIQILPIVALNTFHSIFTVGIQSILNIFLLSQEFCCCSITRMVNFFNQIKALRFKKDGLRSVTLF